MRPSQSSKSSLPPAILLSGIKSQDEGRT